MSRIRHGDKRPTNPRLALFACFALGASMASAQAPSNRFDSAGHPKSNGVQVVVQYPANWSAKEGERPHIVQKFVGKHAGVPAILMLEIRQPGGEIQQNCETLTAGDWKEVFEEPGTLVLSTKLSRHESLPGFVIKMKHSGERAGAELHSEYQVLGVCFKRSLVLASCGVVGEKGEALQMRSVRPLCTQYFNSLVVMDQYR